jgi:hypothetical protein
VRLGHDVLCMGGRRPALGAATVVAADAGDSSGDCGWRGAAATAAGEEGHMGTAVGCVLAPVSTSIGFHWACLNRAFAARRWRGQGEVVVESSSAVAGAGCLCLWPLWDVAAWSGWGLGRAANEQQLRGCAGGCFPSLPRCCCCVGATMVVGLGVVRPLAGGASGCARPLPAGSMLKRLGACYCHDLDCVVWPGAHPGESLH